ncbi:MAG: hypothetical protein WBG48_13900 [Pricia sp.]
MKTTLTVLFLITSLIGMAQEQLNDYKYIIVPKQFAEFKRQNQYQTSTLVKYLFSEKGFQAFYEDELPQDLENNGCLGLRAKLVDGSSMFTTKAAVTLENCNGKEVFTTKEGRSKEKDYKASYAEALRDAFTSFDTVNYAYNGKAENADPVTVNMKNDVKEIAADGPKNYSSANRPDALVQQEATRENQRYVDRRPVPSDLKKAEPKDKSENERSAKMVEQEATREQQSYKDRTPQESDMTRGDVAGQDGDKASDLSTLTGTTLYAQELANGYQLVDSTPRIRIKMEKTSMPDVYLARAGETRGTVFKKNDVWFFEYYSGDDLTTQELSIKF